MVNLATLGSLRFMPTSPELFGLDPVLDQGQVSAWLGVPVATLADWRHRRIGPPSCRIGRHVRYRLHDLEEWLDQQVQPNREPAHPAPDGNEGHMTSPSPTSNTSGPTRPAGHGSRIT